MVDRTIDCLHGRLMLRCCSYLKTTFEAICCISSRYVRQASKGLNSVPGTPAVFTLRRQGQYLAIAGQWFVWLMSIIPWVDHVWVSTAQRQEVLRHSAVLSDSQGEPLATCSRTSFGTSTRSLDLSTLLLDPRTALVFFFSSSFATWSHTSFTLALY